MNKPRTREELFQIADQFRIRRYDDGRIDKIEAYIKNRLIHTSQAIYTTVNGLTRLADIQGFLFPEIWNSLETPEIQWYDRNPKNIYLSYGDFTQLTTPDTLVWTYTVPAGRKAYVELANCQVKRLAAGAGLVCYSKIEASQIASLAVVYLAYANLSGSDAIGSYAQDNSGQSMLLESGDVLNAYVKDLNNPTLTMTIASAKVTEFDA